MSDTPRVLFVGRTRYRLPLAQGAARKWDALSKQFDLRVLGSEAEGSTGSDPRFRLVRASSPGFYAALPLRVARELRGFRPDAIVAQSPYEAAAALAGRRLAGSRARLLLEVHGDWLSATRLYGSPARRLLEPLSRAAARWALRRADGVRTVSAYTSQLVRRLGIEPVATFTTFSDLSAFRGPLAPLPGRPSALFVGVLEGPKNVEGLAAAWRLAATRVPEARLRVVGDGRERAEVERLVRELPTQTSWDARLAPEEVAAALDGATALVLPSLTEGLPRVAIEAFARGRPVVGSRVGGIPDIVEDGVSGLLVPPGDVTALADVLVRVLSDPELAERLAGGARAAAAPWLVDADEFAARMRAVVEELLR